MGISILLLCVCEGDGEGECDSDGVDDEGCCCLLMGTVGGSGKEGNGCCCKGRLSVTKLYIPSSICCGDMRKDPSEAGKSRDEKGVADGVDESNCEDPLGVEAESGSGVKRVDEWPN